MTQPVEQVPLPPRVRAFTTLPRLDYTDCFVARTDGAHERTAEEWARKILEGAPLSFRAAAPGTWFLLGLKHGAPWSRDHVLGWPVRRCELECVLLGADPRTGFTAELLLKRETDSLLFATLIQLDNSPMRRVWSAMEGPHRRIVARLLRRAVRPEEVGDPGFEPGTSSLSETRSNRLS